MQQRYPVHSEFRGGLEAALMGLSTAVGPLVLFMGWFGVQGMAPGYWAALVVVALVPCVRLLLGGQRAVLPAPRAASLATYAGLVLQLSLASAATAPPAGAHGLTAAQLHTGLAAGSLMFLAASALVMLAGLCKIGHIFKMIPTPVTAGISNGTALLLAWLAIVQMHRGGTLAAVTAAGMVLGYAVWSRLQMRLPGLRPIPAIVMAVGIGVALASQSPGAVSASAPEMSFSLQWVSAGMWSELPLQDAGRLLLIGLPGTLTLALVMILETFTTAAMMETRFNLRTEANRELVAVGAANLVSAGLGGVPCTGSLLYSLSSWNAGGRGLGAAFVNMALMALMLVEFGAWLVAMPAGLIAGLLLLQASPLVDPGFRAHAWQMLRTRQWRGAGDADLGFWITAAISVVGGVGSLIWATFLGIGLSSLAVLKRVSVNLTAQWVYLDKQRSRRVRSLEESAVLAQHAHAVGVLRLTGHLFFGNSVRLGQLADDLDAQALAVALDVHQVHEVDPSGLEALRGLVRTLQERRLTVVLSGLHTTPAEALRKALNQLPGVDYRLDLDRGLEACEALVLARWAVAANTRPHTVEHNHLMQDLSPEEIHTVQALSQVREIAQGDALFDRGAPADGVWLLHSGQVSILSGAGVDSSRLATLGPGQFVGEMGLIDGKTRSATARADTAVQAMLIDSRAIATLVEQHPATALKITRNIARELSLRLRTTIVNGP